MAFSNLWELFFVLLIWVSMWNLVEMWCDWMTGGNKIAQVVLYGFIAAISIIGVYFYIYEERERIDFLARQRNENFQ